jgi:hypothetical protein
MKGSPRYGVITMVYSTFAMLVQCFMVHFTLCVHCCGDHQFVVFAHHLSSPLDH